MFDEKEIFYYVEKYYPKHINELKKICDKQKRFSFNELIVKSIMSNSKIFYVLFKLYPDVKIKIGGCLDHENLLHCAAKSSFNILKYLLENGGNPNVKNFEGRTPLHIAVLHKPENVDVLLQHKAEPNITDKYNIAPLHYACTMKNGVKSIKSLLKHKANPNLKISINLLSKPPYKTYETTPLGLATRHLPEAIPLLIENGAFVNLPCTESGYIPLHIAAKYNYKSIQHLLKAKSNIFHSYETPLHTAIMYQNKAIPLLCDAYIIKNYGLSLMVSAMKYNADAIPLLLKHDVDLNMKDENNCNLIHHAIKNNLRSDKLKLLLNKIPNKVKEVDNKGNTPMFYAKMFEMEEYEKILSNYL